MVKQVIASAQITLTDLGDAIISGTKPTNPKLDQLWIERLTGKPDKLWRWNGTSWIEQTLDLGSLDPDADGKIENHETTIGNMVNDAKVDITERQEVKNKLIPIIGQAVADNLTSLPTAAQLWTNGVGEVFTVRKAAQNVGIQTTETVYVAVETAYNSLQTYLNGMTPKPWDASVANKDNAITVVPTDWRTKWLDYYKAVQALTVAVQTKLQGNIDNVNIGVRNILNGSDIVGTNWGSDQGTNSTRTILGTIPNRAIEFKKVVDVAVDINTYQWLSPAMTRPFEVGKEYTLSCDIDSTFDNIRMSVRDNKALKYFYAEQQLKGGWKRHKLTFKYDAAFDNVLVIFVIPKEAPINTIVKLRNFKLEEGNKATDYTMSPEDIDTLIKAADDKAQKVTDSVNDMSSDGKLTPVEKIQLKTDWEIVQSEFNTTLTQADAFNLTSSTERTAFNTAYTALKTFVEPLLMKMNETSTVDRAAFRQRFKDYYDTKAKLLKKISDTSKGLIDAIDVSGRNLLNGTATPTTAIGENRTNQTWTPYLFAAGNSKAIIDASTFCMSFDWVVEGTAAGTLNVQGNNPYPALASTITFSATNNKGHVSDLRSIPNGTGTFTGVNFRLDNFPVGSKLTISNVKIETGNKPTGWTPSPEDVAKAIDDADKKAQLVTEVVNDMSADGKLTPLEKQQAKTEWDAILVEQPQILGQADAFNLASSSERAAYNNNFNMLKAYIEPLLTKLNETSTITRDTFRNNFKNYFDAKAKLLKKISDTSKGLIDGISVNSRNLLLKTVDYILDGTWRWQATTVLNEYYRGTKIAEAATDWASMDYVFSTLGQRGIVKVGDEITMSVSARLVGDNTATRELRFYHDGNPVSGAIVGTVTKDWQRFSITMKVVDTMLKDSYAARFEVSQINNTPIKLQTAEHTLNFGNRDSGWTPAVEDVNQMVSDVDKKAEESKSAISDMSSDSKLTPLEKVQLKKEWGTIAAEKPQFEALGKSYANAATELNAYINAYNALNNTLNGTTGYLKNMASTDTINGATFRSQFDTYYAKQAELIKKVNNLIQGNIDGIQGVKNLLLASKRAISVNDYLLNDFTLTEDFIAGQDYTFVVKGTVPSGQSFGIWQNGGSTNVGYATTEFIKGVYYVTFKAVATTAGNQRSLRLYNVPQNTTNATVEWVALYKGTKPFDWTAAPEDADVGKTNLIVDSEFKYLTSWLRNNTSGITVESGIMPNGVKNVRTLITTTGYYDFAQYIEVEPNTEYTFSCNAGGNFQIFLWEKKADKTATNVYKDNAKSFNLPYDMSSPRSAFTYTIKTQPDAKYIHFIFRVNWGGSGTTGGRIALPQLERGTTASEWKANPFDTSNGEIFIQGSATDITDKNRKLTVNGNVIYDNIDGRGLRLVTLKKDTLAVVDDITYDVYGSDVPRNDLATKINSLGNDVFITLTSCDAINFNTNLLTALVSIGASGTILQGRLPYAFIGMKGLGRYNGLEQWTGLGNMFPPATISCKVVNGMIQGINNNNGQSDANVRKDLRLNAPLPTSILMDANGITASGTDASKYARLDYRGLYIAGGAIQIDGGLSEGQLAQGVTRKMSYLDSNGLYTGQVNIGGSGQNGILSIKNSSNSEIVRGDTNGLTVNNGAITIKRPDGANLIINGMAAYNFAVTTHNPPFRGDNIDTRSWYYHTTKGIPFNRDLQVCDYVATQHTGRYMKMDVDFYTSPSNSGALVVIQAGKYNSGGQEVIVSQIEITNTTPQTNYTLSIDCGVPTYQRIGFYFCLASWSAGDVYARLVRAWMEG